MTYHDSRARSVAATRRMDSCQLSVVSSQLGRECPDSEPAPSPGSPSPTENRELTTDNCPLPLPVWQDAKRSDLYALRITREWSIRQIACLYDVSWDTVQKQLRAWDLVPDDRREQRERCERFLSLPREELRRLYQREGLSQAAIGARHGVGRDLVGKRLAELGLVSSDKVISQRAKGGRWAWACVTAGDLDRLHWDADLSTSEIGRRYRVTYGCVVARMRELGVPRRPIGGGNAPIAVRLRWHNLTDLELARIYHEEDLAPTAIARRFGVTSETVRRRLIAACIPRKHPDYHKAPPAWNRLPNLRQPARHALHLALYRRWIEGSCQLSVLGSQLGRECPDSGPASSIGSLSPTENRQPTTDNCPDAGQT